MDFSGLRKRAQNSNGQVVGRWCVSGPRGRFVLRETRMVSLLRGGFLSSWSKISTGSGWRICACAWLVASLGLPEFTRHGCLRGVAFIIMCLVVLKPLCASSLSSPAVASPVSHGLKQGSVKHGGGVDGRALAAAPCRLCGRWHVVGRCRAELMKKREQMDLRVIRVADDATRCSNYQRLPRGPRMVAGNEVICTGNVLVVRSTLRVRAKMHEVWPANIQ